jgi:acetyl-CoA carboxylase biotin carboxyl carrier protein
VPYNPREVRAEMVANVLAIGVEVGTHVEPGDQLVLLESMKMEIPVLSELSAIVSEVAVSVGDVISAGDLIVRLGER